MNHISHALAGAKEVHAELHPKVLEHGRMEHKVDKEESINAGTLFCETGFNALQKP